MRVPHYALLPVHLATCFLAQFFATLAACQLQPSGGVFTCFLRLLLCVLSEAPFVHAPVTSPAARAEMPSAPSEVLYHCVSARARARRSAVTAGNAD